MTKYIDAEGTAKNFNDALEEAIATASAAVGLEREDVSYELLERGKTGFLGLGGVTVKIRVSYDEPDPPAPKPEAPRSNAPRNNAPRSGAPRNNPPRSDAQRSKPAPAPRNETPATAEQAAEAEGPVRDFLTGLLELMKVNAVPEITSGGDAVNVVINGEDLGALIGRHGETLDALQYITGLAVNRGSDKYVRVNIDMENYREKRGQTLEKLAKRMAERAVKTGRNVTADPMNAHERRILHTALQNYPGVTTFSVGQEPNRRVVIAVAGGRKKQGPRPAAQAGKAAPAEKTPEESGN